MDRKSIEKIERDIYTVIDERYNIRDFFKSDDWEIYGYHSSDIVEAECPIFRFENKNQNIGYSIPAEAIPIVLMLLSNGFNPYNSEFTINLGEPEIEMLNDILPTILAYKKSRACSGPVKLSIDKDSKLKVKCDRTEFVMEK